MARAVVHIAENGKLGCLLSARDVDDLAHVRRLLLQGMLSVEKEGIEEYVMPMTKLALLRNFLHSMGAISKGNTRRLLLMALLQLDDEDDNIRRVVSNPVLPIITGGK